MDQPSFQPVTLNVFPALPMVTVLSHMPGSVATTYQLRLTYPRLIQETVA